MHIRSILAVGLPTTTTLSFAEEINFLPKETGFPNLDYSVKELSNTDTTSNLEIPGFSTRGPEASRWMMCVYTNIAMMRHKKYWTAVYPQSGDNVLVGFPESDNINDLEKLGTEFKGDYELKKILPVEKMLYFCAHLGYKFKYVPSSN